MSFGYFNAPHYWDVFAQYAYLHADGSNEVHAPKGADTFLNGTWIQPDIGIPATPAPLRKASSDIAMTYQVLDFLFSAVFRPTST